MSGSDTEPERAPLTGLALRLAEALAEQFTVPKYGRATEATDWENPILDGMAERIDKGMSVHFIAEDGHPAFRHVSPAEAVAVLMPLVDDALTRARHMSGTGRCKHCGASWNGEHRMRCQFYVGPLSHEMSPSGRNGTFGGTDYYCVCGGWFRQGGLAGHGDGSEDAEPVCPNVDQDWRGPRPEASATP